MIFDQVNALYDGGASGFIYADGHPNAAQTSPRNWRGSKGGEAGLICASGMGAIRGGLPLAPRSGRGRSSRMASTGGRSPWSIVNFRVLGDRSQHLRSD